MSTFPVDVNGSLMPQAELPGADGRTRESLDPDDLSGGWVAWSGTSFAAPALAAWVMRALLDGAAGVGLRLVLASGSPRQVFSWLERSRAQSLRVRPVRPLSRLDLADGPLMAYDVQRLSVPPRQVMLSACHVGRAVVRSGDEVLGFTAAHLVSAEAHLAGSGPLFPRAGILPSWGGTAQREQAR